MDNSETDINSLSGDGEDTSKLDKEIAELQEELNSLRTKNKEEKFLWILGVLILLDSFWFANVSSWGGPIIIGILEIMFMMIVAQNLSIAAFSALVHKALDMFKRTPS